MNRDTTLSKNYITVFITLLFSKIVTNDGVGTFKTLHHFTFLLWSIFFYIMNSLDTILACGTTLNLDTAPSGYPGASCVRNPLSDCPLDNGASVHLNRFTSILCGIFSTWLYVICVCVITRCYACWGITGCNILLSTFWKILCDISVYSYVEALSLILYFTLFSVATENI